MIQILGVQTGLHETTREAPNSGVSIISAAFSTQGPSTSVDLSTQTREALSWVIYIICSLAG